MSNLDLNFDRISISGEEGFEVSDAMFGTRYTAGPCH